MDRQPARGSNSTSKMAGDSGLTWEQVDGIALANRINTAAKVNRIIKHWPFVKGNRGLPQAVWLSISELAGQNNRPLNSTFRRHLALLIENGNVVERSRKRVGHGGRPTVEYKLVDNTNLTWDDGMYALDGITKRAKQQASEPENTVLLFKSSEPLSESAKPSASSQDESESTVLPFETDESPEPEPTESENATSQEDTNLLVSKVDKTICDVALSDSPDEQPPLEQAGALATAESPSKMPPRLARAFRDYDATMRRRAQRKQMTPPSPPPGRMP